MTDDPRRRHLTPEEAAELRRRARQRRGYLDPVDPDVPAARPGPRQGGSRDDLPGGESPRARPPRPVDPARDVPRVRRRQPGEPRVGDPRAIPGRDPRAAGRADRLPPTGSTRRERLRGTSADRQARDHPEFARTDRPRPGERPRQGDRLPPTRRVGEPARGVPPRGRVEPVAGTGYRRPPPIIGHPDDDRRPRGASPRDPAAPSGRHGRRRTAPAGRGGRAAGRRRRWWRLIPLALVLILVAAGILVVSTDAGLQRVDALPAYEGRGGNTPGSVTLIVGTDSREGLSPEEQARLSTGSESDAGGKRTDTMMLVYTPRDGGRTMVVSLPRDLLVTIPGQGEAKLNAAYAYGGAPLLARTLEEQTGVRIDHYVEIGFGGFAGIVDALGGVDICVEQPIADPLAGIDLPAGCQLLDGPQALGFVRTRHGFAEQDLQRVRNQRAFLAALSAKAMQPGTVLNPFRMTTLVDRVSQTVIVDSGDHLWSLASVMWKLRNDPQTVTAPFDGMASGDVGSYLVWGPSTTEFFDAMAHGRTPTVPEGTG